MEDYTQILEHCESAVVAGVSQETGDYAQRLMAWAYNRRGELHAAAGEDAAALADFEAAVRREPTRWRALHNRGVSHAMQGNYEQAIADFNRTIELNPTFANAYFNRGELRYETGEFALAVEDYDRSILLVRDDATAFNSRGHAHYRLGRFREAIRDFTEALRLDPKHAAALTNRGDVFAELGYYAEALRDYQRALGLEPASGRTHQSIAWLVATCPDPQFRDAELALSAAQKAIQLDGDNDHRYLATLAAAHAEAGHFDQAREALTQAIAKAPADETPVYTERLALYGQERAFRVEPKEVANRIQEDKRQ
jgi:tetratricopeptide (TPR) repeat protein